IQTDLQECLLRGVEINFSSLNLQEAVDSRLVTQLRQLKGFGSRSLERPQGVELARISCFASQRIRDLTKRCLDGFFVLCHRNVLASLRKIQVATEPARKNRHLQLWRKLPEVLAR